MRRPLRILVLASLTVGGALAQTSDKPLSDDELRLLALKKFAYNTEHTLRVTRDHCASGKMQEILVGLNAKGNPSPPTDVYCRYVLREFGKRSLIWDYYAQIAFDASVDASEMTPEIVTEQYKRVKTALTAERSTYLDAKGNAHRLTCSLSYDAGYVFGIENPHSDDFPTLTEAKANEIARECYTRNIDGRKRYGFAAGVFHGRVDAKAPSMPVRLY